MLPSVVANELKDAIGQYLRSAFPIATPWFQRRAGGSEPDPHALIDELISRPGALFKGPWLDIKMPFRLADARMRAEASVALGAPLHRHRAFQSLILACSELRNMLCCC
jgi:DEAD/DEAH box helicase domain-containing protein